MKKKIIVASRNPIKAEAVLRGFSRMFPNELLHVEGIQVASGVSDQPMSDQVTRQGAITRAKKARDAAQSSDFWVGLEGGCDYQDDRLVAFAWIVVLSGDLMGSARTAIFQLPQEVQSLVESGLELGEADDRAFGENNSKQNSGAVGLLTRDVVTRTSLYEQAVILALIPFKNQKLYQPISTE